MKWLQIVLSSNAKRTQSISNDRRKWDRRNAMAELTSFLVRAFFSIYKQFKSWCFVGRFKNNIYREKRKEERERERKEAPSVECNNVSCTQNLTVADCESRIYFIQAFNILAINNQFLPSVWHKILDVRINFSIKTYWNS